MSLLPRPTRAVIRCRVLGRPAPAHLGSQSWYQRNNCSLHSLLMGQTSDSARYGYNVEQSPLRGRAKHGLSSRAMQSIASRYDFVNSRVPSHPSIPSGLATRPGIADTRKPRKVFSIIQLATWADQCCILRPASDPLCYSFTVAALPIGHSNAHSATDTARAIHGNTYVWRGPIRKLAAASILSESPHI